jgi:hypothetical protein
MPKVKERAATRQNLPKQFKNNTLANPYRAALHFYTPAFDTCSTALGKCSVAKHFYNTSIANYNGAADNYTQKPVIPGIYQINISAEGFQDKTITAVEVPLGKTITLNIQLTPKT